MNSEEIIPTPSDIPVYLPSCDWSDVKRIIDEYVDANNQVNAQAQNAIANMQEAIDARIKQNENYADIKRRISLYIDADRAVKALREEEDSPIQETKAALPVDKPLRESYGKRNTRKPKTTRRRN